MMNNFIIVYRWVANQKKKIMYMYSQNLQINDGSQIVIWKYNIALCNVGQWE